MVIHNLNISSIIGNPLKPNPPLIVDTNAPLTIPITGKLLQPVARRDAQKIKGGSAAELFQFALGNTL